MTVWKYHVQSWTKTSTGDSFSTEGLGVAYGTCNGMGWLLEMIVLIRVMEELCTVHDGQSWTKTSTGDSFSEYCYGVAYGTCNGIPLWVAVGHGWLWKYYVQ